MRHEDVYFNRRDAAPTTLTTGGLAAQSVNSLCKDAAFPRSSARPFRVASRRFRHALSWIMRASGSRNFRTEGRGGSIRGSYGQVGIRHRMVRVKGAARKNEGEEWQGRTRRRAP